jgi:PKD repeat protein
MPNSPLFLSWSWFCSAGAQIPRTSCLVLGLLTTIRAHAQPFTPPPKPSVAPLISEIYPNDADRDHIEDALSQRAGQALARRQSATPVERAGAEATLAGLVEVELIFRSQITQEQIDTFLNAGGAIDYIYRTVSYGWNGRVPLGQVPIVAAAMSNALVLIQEPKPAKLHLDTATRTGRVRPIWAPGFAGVASGVQGSSNITIAICDTGTDESHSDLAGRRVYWHDFSTDAAVSPVDLIQHGSHVMGIATGSGISSGNVSGTLQFTDEYTLSGVPNGSFYPNPIELPATPVTVTITSRWNGSGGGGSTTLHLLYHTRGTSGGYTAQASVTGTSPLTLTTTFTPTTSRVYSPALVSNGHMSDYVTTCQIAGYPAVGDGFNTLRGVAPGCNWACAKVFTSAGSGVLSWTDAAIDDLVANRIANNIKVMNLSLGANGSPGIDTTTRQKINSAVNNGIVAVISAGNDGGTQQVDDPGRAAMALTIGAANDVNQLTDYTSEGFSSPSSTPGQEEDYKPDIIAPGGSANYYSAILSVDSNSGDGAFSDQQTNDYYNIQGTSMASPFAAGCAALVIDALQKSGVTWNFNSSIHSRLVKMVLCATATESNVSREGNANNPTLQRATAGPNGFPIAKDQYEGYGMINPDAAVEAVSLTYTNGTTATNSLGSNATDRRAWARKVILVAGQAFNPTLTVPVTGDFDLYLYSSNSSAYGTPLMLASSTAAASGGTETFNYTSTSNQNAILVVKWVSGSGAFNLSTPPGGVIANFIANATNGFAPLTVNFTNLSTGATNYAWDFGDGHSSSATNAINTYLTAGTYSVTLTAVGPSGTNVLTRANYIVVTNALPPVAGFAATPTNGLAPLTVQFTNSSTGANSYAWDFGDGKTSTATNPSNTYSNAGAFTVSLTAIGPGGTNLLVRTNYIITTNYPPPVANFVANPTNGAASLSVTFTNLSANAISYLWNFGDGKSSTATNTSNTYTNPGTYTVTLTASGPGGTNTLTRTNYILVTNPPPVAGFAATPTNGLAPLTVQFTNSSTGANSYAWDFGDGKTSTATNPSNTYSNAGAFTVSLTAIGAGGTNLLVRTNYVITTNYPPPIANFIGGPTNGVAPLSVSFTNLSSNATSYTWDFGNGNTSTGTNASNIYTNPGTYNVTLTAAGLGGTNALTRTNYIVVLYPSPVPDFAGEPTNGIAPLSVSFTNLSANASSYTWDFGDGNSSTATNASNIYTNPGTYTITLTAAGPGGTNALTQTNYIVVLYPPPVADFAGEPTNGIAPLSVAFTNLSANASSYIWDFGDGNSSIAANVSNIYTNPGTYTVTLTAAGLGGTNALTRTNYIVVLYPPPVVDFAGEPTNGIAPLSVAFTNLSANASSYLWDFGDGNNSTNLNPVNLYTNGGSFTVTLTAVGAGGTNSIIRTNYILVTEPPHLVVTPANLDFGVVLTGLTSQAAFVISNAGSATLVGTSAVPVGPFQLLDSSNAVSTLPFAVTGASSTNIFLQFSPITFGAFSNLVTFISNGGDSTNAVLGQGMTPPLILLPTLAGNSFFFSFETVSGKVYDVQFKDTLDDPVWQTLISYPGEGTVMFHTNDTTSNPQRFYRLLVH